MYFSFTYCFSYDIISDFISDEGFSQAFDFSSDQLTVGIVVTKYVFFQVF